jgi:hypothetical protein
MEMEANVRKLLLLFPLLFGCAYFRHNPYEGVGADRHLFIRNGIPDTLNVQVVSPDDKKHRAFVTIAPGDSACVKYPFLDVRVVLIVSTRTEVQYFGKYVENPGLDWLLVSEDQTPPPLGVCVGG